MSEDWLCYGHGPHVVFVEETAEGWIWKLKTTSGQMINSAFFYDSRSEARESAERISEHEAQFNELKRKLQLRGEWPVPNREAA